ncbi:MAG: PAS domain S-box protein, partial [Methanoregula sp.]|nr:PAS domain S-box protein [Methanoregula sp.]
KSLLDITHPAHVKFDLVQVKKLYAGELATYQTEKRYLKKDGSDFWCAVTVSPLKDEHHRIIAAIVLIEDISGWKIAEEKLRESEEKYRHVFDWANEAIMLHPLTTSTQSGRFIEVNTAACRMLGYSREELLTMGPAYLLPAELRSLTGNMIRQAETKDTFLFETRLQRKDGTTFPVESNARLVTFGGRRVWLSLIRDITERKRSEDALRKSETRYRSLAETSQDLIFVIGRDDTVEYVNSYAAHLIRKPPEEVVGNPRSTLFPPAIAERQNYALQQVFLTGNPARSEGALVMNDEKHWFDHFLAPIRDANGSIQSVLGISRDITKRKLLEERLWESEQNFRLLAENSVDIIIRMNTGTMCSYVSPAVTTLLGYTQDEVVGQAIMDYVHPEDTDLVKSGIRDLLAEHPFQLAKFRVRHKNGHYVWFESTIRTIRDASTGAVAEFYCVSRDITGRIEAEDTEKKCKAVP